MIKSKILHLAILAYFTFNAAQVFAGTITATSQQGLAVTMTFETDTITSDTTTAVFCLADASRPAVAVQSAKLWMPEHGHGSSPTTLVASGTHCTNISGINFVMNGKWEIRIKLAGGDAVAFPVDVESTP